MRRRSCCAAGKAYRALIWVGLTTILLGVVGCTSLSSKGPKMGLVAVADDGTGFVEQSSGLPFVPFGTNYYDPNTGWPPQVWQQFDPNHVTEHFAVMSKLGVNCARVFLAAATFQPDANTVDEGALAKLDQLVEIARNAGIRLILTGPDHWEGRPSYWTPDRFAGPEALKALDTFWTELGQRYRGEPAILAWDLLNEPQMPWSEPSWQPGWNAWLQSKYTDRDGLKTAWADELGNDEQLGTIEAPKDAAEEGNPRLRDWQLFREHLADQWVQRQVQTLRAADPTHMITVGYIQWSYPLVRPGDPHLYSAFNPQRQAQWLDFISVHFYPLGQPFVSKDNWDRNVAYLQGILAYCRVGKPVVLSEYGWYGGGYPDGRPYLSEDQQSRWIKAEVEASRRLADGWLSWPFADTPESTDMSMYGGLVNPNMLNKLWAVRFQSYATNLSLLRQPTPELPSFDFGPFLTASMNDLMSVHDEYARKVQEALSQADPVPPIEMPAEFTTVDTEKRIH